MTSTAGSTLADELLALGELAGRFAAQRAPSIRRYAKRWVRRPAAAAPRLSLDSLRAEIRALGHEPGRDLLVHSALIRTLDASLDETIDMLGDLVGPSGTMLMPSHPLLTKKREGIWVYDTAKSRSRVGLLSERFRRTAGVRRSPFPVAPVCALGPAAGEYTTDFREASGGVPYGRGSPYHHLCERRGQVLFLGIDFVRALTLEHVAFDLEPEEHPVGWYYTSESFWVVQADTEGLWEVRHARQVLQRRLATAAMRRMVLRSGTIRVGQVGGIPLAVLDADAFLRWHAPLARARGWPYWTPPVTLRRGRRRR